LESNSLSEITSYWTLTQILNNYDHITIMALKRVGSIRV